MARFAFGGEVTQLMVSEDAANADALIIAPGAALPLYDDADGSLVTDFLLWNQATDTFPTPASSIVASASGYLPRFQGPDGLDTLWVEASDGMWLRLFSSDAAAAPGAGAESWAEVAAFSDFPTVLAAGATQAAARTAIGAGTPTPEWSTLANKPAVVAEGATQAAARTAIGVDLTAVMAAPTAGLKSQGLHTSVPGTYQQDVVFIKA